MPSFDVINFRCYRLLIGDADKRYLDHDTISMLVMKRDGCKDNIELLILQHAFVCAGGKKQNVVMKLTLQLMIDFCLIIHIGGAYKYAFQFWYCSLLAFHFCTDMQCDISDFFFTQHFIHSEMLLNLYCCINGYIVYKGTIFFNILA